MQEPSATLFLVIVPSRCGTSCLDRLSDELSEATVGASIARFPLICSKNDTVRGDPAHDPGTRRRKMVPKKVPLGSSNSARKRPRMWCGFFRFSAGQFKIRPWDQDRGTPRKFLIVGFTWRGGQCGGSVSFGQHQKNGLGSGGVFKAPIQQHPTIGGGPG